MTNEAGPGGVGLEDIYNIRGRSRRESILQPRL